MAYVLQLVFSNHNTRDGSTDIVAAQRKIETLQDALSHDPEGLFAHRSPAEVRFSANEALKDLEEVIKRAKARVDGGRNRGYGPEHVQELRGYYEVYKKRFDEKYH